MITVQTDGATNQKAEKSGIGIYISAQGQYESFSYPIAFTSNHEAEFQAVIEALKICNEKYPSEILAFQSDSAVLVDAIEKAFTKNKTFQPLLAEILRRIEVHPHFFIKWIPSKQNIHADKLAKRAIST